MDGTDFADTDELRFRQGVAGEGRKKKLLIALAAVIAAAALLLFLPVNRMFAQNASVPAPVSSPNLQNEPLLESCSAGEMADEDCLTLFSSPDVGDRCKAVLARDKCFFNAAIINLRRDFCAELADSALKSECEIRTMPVIPPAFAEGATFEQEGIMPGGIAE